MARCPLSYAEPMSDRVMSYLEMCQREGISLQRGMNFRVRGSHSVLLMSLRPNAPYRDRLQEEGTVLLYEGHDAPRQTGQPDPKQVDQPALTPHGRPTENGTFFAAALATARGEAVPNHVQVARSCEMASGPTTEYSFSRTPCRRPRASGRCSCSHWKRSRIRGPEQGGRPATQNRAGGFPPGSRWRSGNAMPAGV